MLLVPLFCCFFLFTLIRRRVSSRRGAPWPSFTLFPPRRSSDLGDANARTWRVAGSWRWPPCRRCEASQRRHGGQRHEPATRQVRAFASPRSEERRGGKRVKLGHGAPRRDETRRRIRVNRKKQQNRGTRSMDNQ